MCFFLAAFFFGEAAFFLGGRCFFLGRAAFFFFFGESELVQSQQSRTEAQTRADCLSLIALKPPSDFGADTLVGRIPGRWTGSV